MSLVDSAVTREDMLFILDYLAVLKRDQSCRSLAAELRLRWSPAPPEVIEQPGNPGLFHRGGCMCPECGKQPVELRP
jgi:hypothetical protein